MKGYVAVIREEISTEDVGDMMKLKESIIPTFVNTEMNRKQLEQVPHKNMLDLSIVYRFVKKDEDGFSAAIVTGEALEHMGLSPDELDAMARENFKLQFPAGVVSLLDNLMVMTNENGIFGASGILDKDLLKDVSSEMKGDFYVLPISMHEMMIVPVIADDIDRLKGIVAEGNSRFVPSEDFLSDSIYRYDSDTGELILEAVQEDGEMENL